MIYTNLEKYRDSKEGYKLGRCFLWIKHKLRWKVGKGWHCIHCGKGLTECMKEAGVI